MTTDSPRLRLRILGIVVLSLFAALFARLWYLQVVGTEEYRLAAEVQNTRRVSVEAPRGRILDVKGRVLVDNRISINVVIDPNRLAELDDPDAMLLRLAEELTSHGYPTKLVDLKERLSDPQYNPVEPRPVAVDVSEELEVFLLERAEEFPVLEVQREAVREYPYGPLAAHILGYVGRINEDELAERMGDAEPDEVAKPYEANDHIGKTGVERVHEDDLRGVPGVRTIEVDARGEPIRTLSYDPPQPGNDVQLTLDLDVQALAEQAVLDGLLRARELEPSGNNPQYEAPAGSAVVLDPRTGSLVAMASYPTYDPEEFVNGIDDARYRELLGDEASSDPFTNRAIAGEYAPGSTFKLVTAYAAMKNGLINQNTSYNDRGSYTAQGCAPGVGGCTTTNAGGAAYGSVNVTRAITVSSDVFFYWLGDRFWIESGVDRNGIQNAAEQLGLGAPTGIPLPFEKDGHIPTPERRAQRHEENPEAFPNAEWYSGDNIITAIGQGDVLVTPLQLANLYATFGNRGSVLQPQVVARVLEPGGDPANPDDVVRLVQPEVRAQVDMPPSIHQPMLQGFVGVTNGDGGTATRVFEGWDHAAWPVAGKTGTAEVRGKADTSVFAAFGPAHDPRYAVAVIMEESGFGAESAAPVVRRILEPLAGQVPLPPALTLEQAAQLPPPEVIEACVARGREEGGEESPASSTTTTTTPGEDPCADLVLGTAPVPVPGSRGGAG